METGGTVVEPSCFCNTKNNRLDYLYINKWKKIK